MIAIEFEALSLHQILDVHADRIEACLPLQVIHTGKATISPLSSCTPSKAASSRWSLLYGRYF
jgi:hypothetical protein